MFPASATFLGYRRDNGRVGIRNHVLVLPVDAAASVAAQAVGRAVHGAVALSHQAGPGLYGADLDLFLRTLIGLGVNPNVAAVVVVGADAAQTKWLVDRIAVSGKPVVGFAIQTFGDRNTVLRASRAAAEFVQWASEQQREVVPLSELWVSVSVGDPAPGTGSGYQPTASVVGEVMDALYAQGATLGAGETASLDGYESDAGFRCRDDVVRARLQEVLERYRDLHQNRRSIAEVPSGWPDAVAVAGIGRIGTATSIDGVLDKAQVPPHAGLWFVDTPSAPAEALTLFAAAGYVLHIFPTDSGNPIGNPVLPVLKVSANASTLQDLAEHLDEDISPSTDGEYGGDTSSARLSALVQRTINGRLVAAEVTGHQEFALTRLYESA
jgi:(2R)-sulfolactate sulfo-lyase subunit beta